MKAPSEATGILFVDDEIENVALMAELIADSLDIVVEVVPTVEAAVHALHSRDWRLVVMDLFIPLGDHAERILGPRAKAYQADVDHLGGLVLLEELERLPRLPLVVSHTACTDHLLLSLFGEVVVRRIPKPAPLDTALSNVMDVYRGGC